MAATPTVNGGGDADPSSLGGDQVILTEVQRITALGEEPMIRRMGRSVVVGIVIGVAASGCRDATGPYRRVR
jgi:hypothetical protein